MIEGRGNNFIAVIAICFMFLLANVSVATAGSYEYPHIYKSPRVMGMGGANVAIGGGFDSVFYNPAGLTRMPEYNWEVNVLGLSGTVGEDTLDFVDDLNDAFDEEDDLTAVNDVLKDYRGKHIHFDAANLSSVAKNAEKLAFGLGGLASVVSDSIPHQGFGEDGLLEMHASMQYGGIGGVAYRVSDQLSVGASVKLINKEVVDHFFTATEIIEHEDDLEDYFTDELKEDGTGVGVDAGIIYEFMQDSKLKPAVGVSIQNIGDMDFGDAGTIPMTVNVGASATVNLPVLQEMVVGIDYVDAFNNYEQDDDIGKRVRLGGEIGIIDNTVITAAVRAGLYQGYPTFGADLRLFMVALSYTTYAEEVGAYAGQDDDRRHMVSLNVGW